GPVGHRLVDPADDPVTDGQSVGLVLPVSDQFRDLEPSRLRGVVPGAAVAEVDAAVGRVDAEGAVRERREVAVSAGAGNALGVEAAGAGTRLASAVDREEIAGGDGEEAGGGRGPDAEVSVILDDGSNPSASGVELDAAGRQVTVLRVGAIDLHERDAGLPGRR